MLLWNRTQIAAKIETVEGSPESLSADDVLLAANVSFKPNIEMAERPLVSASLSSFGKAPGAQSATISFDVELKGSGEAGTPPEFGKLLRACGMSETINEGTSVIYQPASAEIPSLTIACIIDGKKYQAAGCRGTFKLDLRKGEPGILHFDFTGTNISNEDQNLFQGVEYLELLPPVFQDANLQIDSFSAIVESLSIELGNNVVLRPDANAQQGYKCAVITKRESKLTFNPEDVAVSDYDFLSKWKNGSFLALSFALQGGAGNNIAISCPKVQFEDISPAERDGIAVLEITGILVGHDDELKLEFT